MTTSPSTSTAAAAERAAARTAHYAAGLYRPSGSSRVLGDDHPVEGEVRGLAASVHPDDAALEAAAARAAAADRAALDYVHHLAWHRHEHMVDVDADGHPIPYIRSRNR